MNVKDTIANAKSVIMGLPSQVKSFFRNSLAGYIMEVKSLNDALIYSKYWTLIWAAIFKLILKVIFKKGPLVLIRQLIHYPWILHTPEGDRPAPAAHPGEKRGLPRIHGPDHSWHYADRG